jgi:predicted transcriptional regulator
VTVRNSSSSRLTPLQQAILERLWSHGPATADALREALARRHPLKDSSVRTLLRRLEARGLLAHSVEGKAFVYRANVPPTKLAARAVEEIVERFCSGSMEQFLVGMVDERLVSPAELERLARKVRRKR